MGNTLSNYPVGEHVQGKTPLAVEGPLEEEDSCKSLKAYSRTNIKNDLYLKDLASDLATFYNKITKKTFQQELILDTVPRHPIVLQGYIETIMVTVNHLVVSSQQQQQTAAAPPPPPPPTPTPTPPPYQQEYMQPQPQQQQEQKETRVQRKTPTPGTVIEALLLICATIIHCNSFHHYLAEKSNAVKKHKKKLVALTVELEKLLMYYTYNNENIKIQRAACAEIKEKMKAVRHSLRHLKQGKLPDPQFTVHAVYPETVLCCFLGIKEEQGLNIRKVIPWCRDHQPDLYWMNRVLENNYSKMIEDNAMASSESINTKQQFMALGFTESRSEILASWLKNDPLSCHQSVLYFAQRYVETVFQRDIFLCSTKRYPYEGSIEETKAVDIETDGRVPEEDEDSTPDKIPVNYINLEGLNSKAFVPPSSDKDFLVLFHGTDHNSAEHILKNGIMVKCGRQRQDFSHGRGFYLSEDLNYSQKWAHFSSFPSPPAVLCFKFPKKLFSKFLGLTLTQSDKEQMNLWEEIITYNHHGQDLSKVNTNSDKIHSFFNGKGKLDYIEGPVSKVHGENMAMEEVSQLCILTPKMGEALSDPRFIHTVLFG